MSKKYNKKNNMKQAMYEMFGVGEEQAEEALYQEPAEDEMAEIIETVPAVEAKEVETKEDTDLTFDQMIKEYVPAKKLPVSYFAPGTVFEGTLKAEGDVEIAGEFNGDVTSAGNVILNSAICGDIFCTDLKMEDCVLVGNVEARGSVNISESSKVRGNIAATELQCAGQINGNLTVSGDTALDKTASIHGIITTGTMSMEKGAMIKGGIEMNGTADDK